MTCQCKPIRWDALTEAQQQSLGNGCGPSWLPQWLTKLLFGWFFDASCRRHDFGYMRGGSKQDRYRVDNGFFIAMTDDARRLSPIKRNFAWCMAYIFYKLVRWFGWMRFHYGPYRTIDHFFMTQD